MLQTPDDEEDGNSVHAPELLKPPPAPPSRHLRVPAGDEAVPLLRSVTVAVKVIVFPIITYDGLGDTEEDVARLVG